jgi:thioredoxin 1
MATVDLNYETFKQHVEADGIVIVDFWASWCGPCKAFAPTYAAASEKHPEVVFGKVDTESEQALAGHFNIRSIPTLMVFRDKVLLFQQAGALPPDALEEVINKCKGLDMADVQRQIAEAEAAAEAEPEAPA